jgi:hypothetical protein
MPNKTPYVGALGFLIAIVADVAANIWLQPQWAWLTTVVLMIGGFAVIGLQVSGVFGGIVIDNRNRVSLSKFQAAAWTVLILSALVSATAWNLSLGSPDPLGIKIAPELLVAMGIAATSFVATPMLLSLKQDDTPTPQDIQRAADAMGSGQSPDLASSGKLFVRSDPKGARWTDMFRGDEVGNVASPDLSKVQQFLITLVLIAVYAAAVWHMFADQQMLADQGKLAACVAAAVKHSTKCADLGKYYLGSLPPFQDQFVWLMGISHAGYLAYKAAPHTQSAGEGAAAPDPRLDAAG